MYLNQYRRDFMMPSGSSPCPSPYRSLFGSNGPESRMEFTSSRTSSSTSRTSSGSTLPDIMEIKLNPVKKEIIEIKDDEPMTKIEKNPSSTPEESKEISKKEDSTITGQEPKKKTSKKEKIPEPDDDFESDTEQTYKKPAKSKKNKKRKNDSEDKNPKKKQKTESDSDTKQKKKKPKSKPKADYHIKNRFPSQKLRKDQLEKILQLYHSDKSRVNKTSDYFKKLAENYLDGFSVTDLTPYYYGIYLKLTVTTEKMLEMIKEKDGPISKNNSRARLGQRLAKIILDGNVENLKNLEKKSTSKSGDKTSTDFDEMLDQGCKNISDEEFDDDEDEEEQDEEEDTDLNCMDDHYDMDDDSGNEDLDNTVQNSLESLGKKNKNRNTEEPNQDSKTTYPNSDDPLSTPPTPRLATHEFPNCLMIPKLVIRTKNPESFYDFEHNPLPDNIISLLETDQVLAQELYDPTLFDLFSGHWEFAFQLPHTTEQISASICQHEDVKKILHDMAGIMVANDPNTDGKNENRDRIQITYNNSMARMDTGKYLKHVKHPCLMGKCTDKCPIGKVLHQISTWLALQFYKNDTNTKDHVFRRLNCLKIIKPENSTKYTCIQTSEAEIEAAQRIYGAPNIESLTEEPDDDYMCPYRCATFYNGQKFLNHLCGHKIKYESRNNIVLTCTTINNAGVNTQVRKHLRQLTLFSNLKVMANWFCAMTHEWFKVAKKEQLEDVDFQKLGPNLAEGLKQLNMKVETFDYLKSVVNFFFVKPPKNGVSDDTPEKRRKIVECMVNVCNLTQETKRI